MTHDSWTYPKDVPSAAMRQHQRPRKSWTGRVVLGLSIAAVIAMWAGVALAEVNRAAFASEREPTHDAQGRYILRGDPDARPSPHHSGGSLTGWTDDYYLSLRPLGPFRIEGEWFSAGTMVLALVAGPTSVPGSCLGNVRMSFHGSRSATPEPYEIEYANLLLPPLRNRFLAGRYAGTITFYGQMHRTQNDLGQDGYHVCAREEQ